MTQKEIKVLIDYRSLKCASMGPPQLLTFDQQGGRRAAFTWHLAHPMLSLGQFMFRKAKLWIVTILVTCVVLAVAIPNFIRARQSSATNACINNLRQIEAARMQWELEACTTNYQNDGFLRIESYIDRLLRSPKESSAVVVTTADCPFALLVKREGFRTIVSIGPDPPDRPLNGDEETKIREFFSRRGMTPFREVPSANPLYDHGRYGIEFQISGDSKAIARFCVSVFTDLYGATDQGGLSSTTFGLQAVPHQSPALHTPAPTIADCPLSPAAIP